MAEPIHVVGPYGEAGTVAEADVPKVIEAGGRIATPEEAASARADERYASKSTAEKVTSFLSLAGPVPFAIRAGVKLAQGKGDEIAPTLSPGMEAYTQGVSNTFTGGLASVGMKELVRVAGGDEAAKAYGQNALDAEKAHEGLYHTGQLAGFLGSASAAGGTGSLGKAIPGVGISAAGDIAEQGAARLTAGLAERGALGRAAASGINLGVRGGVEGALYGAANQYSEDKLGDKEIVADKIFAAAGLGGLGGFVGGATLGGAGSLAKTGAMSALDATAGRISRGLADAAAKGEKAAADVGAKADAAVAEAKDLGKFAAGQAREAGADLAAKARETGADLAAKGQELAAAGVQKGAQGVKAAGEAIAEATGTKVPQEGQAFSALMERAASKDAQKGIAYDQAWKAIGAGNGLQSTRFAKEAERYLPNGTRDVGEVILRRGIIKTDDGLIAAMRNGTAADLAPRIAAEQDIVGKQIGDITAASGGRIPNAEIINALKSAIAPYEASAATRPVAKNLRQFATDLVDSLGMTSSDGSVAVQDLLRERKALDSIVFQHAPLDPALQIEVKRELRSKLEGLIISSLDESSGKVPGELAQTYKALKKDYTALSIASNAAEDSAARAAKGASLGLRDMLFGGGGLTGLAMGAGHKVIRERGNAAAAVLLYRMAELGTLTKIVSGIDDGIGRAAKGLLVPPKAKALPLATEAEAGREAQSVAGRAATVVERAQAAARRVAAVQANPESFTNHVNAQTERLSATAPELAGALQQRIVRAMAFLAGKTPSADPDPYDPHPAPKFNDSSAASYLRYHYYAEKPERFFTEVEHGKITHEGAETAAALMPDAFEELRVRMGAEVADAISRGVKVPFEQRRRIDSLLGTQTDPSSRPEMMKLLQANVQPVADSGKLPPGATAPASPPKRPLPTKTSTQQSPYDRLTQGIGRR